MKYLINFDENCPKNMGRSQLTDNIQRFIEERAYIIFDSELTKTSITFKDQEGNVVTGTIEYVSDDYDNSL